VNVGAMNLLLTRKQVAVELYVSIETVDWLITLGCLKTIHLAGLVLIPRTQLDRFARWIA
jgi:orotate phosphoribosyltransferase-like protein